MTQRGHFCLYYTISITIFTVTATKPKPAQTKRTDESFTPSQDENLCDAETDQSSEKEKTRAGLFNPHNKITPQPCWTACQEAAMDKSAEILKGGKEMGLASQGS